MELAALMLPGRRGRGRGRGEEGGGALLIESATPNLIVFYSVNLQKLQKQQLLCYLHE
jgi:hypothetical protein